jgi:hypothetical protein
LPFSFAFCNAGSNIAASTAITATTTSNSMSVNARGQEVETVADTGSANAGAFLEGQPG